MSRIHGKNTLPELLVRKGLHALGFRFRLHSLHLPGRPDLSFPGRRKAMFVHGCFWHGHDCTHGRRRPSTNVTFWAKKLQDNHLRDLRKRKALEELGWGVLEIWECEVKAGTWVDRATTFLKSSASRRAS